MEKKLEVKNLQVSFRTQGGILKAVRDISFDLYKGETLAIVGESGSGKSVTSKAIIGILSNNSIVEGGEILYDGQDLLKIDEEHFHKIRGDKISMIFQDPLSSLNPIMRIGKQLTEAMILNGKARQKHAREDFNRLLKTLNKKLDEENLSEAANHKLQCTTFDNFCILSTQLELAYNNAQNAAITLKSNIENTIFLIEKRQKVDCAKEAANVVNKLQETIHEYVITNDEIAPVVEELKLISKTNKNQIDNQYLISKLNEVVNILDAGIKKEAPNFFRLGYYMYKNNNVLNEKFNNVDELNKYMREYLDANFMNSFIDLAAKGLQYSYNQSIDAKKAILARKDEFINYFAQENLDFKDSLAKAKELSKLVKGAINYLSIHKKGVEYSFASSINHDLLMYFKGLKNNPKMQAKYDKQLRKYNKIVEAGKNPTWKVNPPLIVDLELARKNISRIVESLFASYERSIARVVNFDAKERTIQLIDELKELASRVVYKVTKSLAKVKAIELMKEVGIPEPAIRFKQYPFEFSGGMRQRIVIAIALSANPDILICDEPTTALDVTIQSQILELINKIKKERNLSVIFITHDLGVVANMADRIAVMYAGKIVEYGTADDIFYDPRHPYTWALLSSMPDLDTKEKLDAIPGTPPNMIYPPIGDAFAERNKYALEIDYEMQPPMFKVSDTHFAATWLLHPNAPKVNPPKVITDRIERMKGRA